MPDLLVLIHERLATTALYYFLIIALWGYYKFFRKQSIDSSYWGILAIAEILVLGEALLGGYLWFSGFRPARGWLHILYGSLIPAMIPLAYAYTRGRAQRAEILVYGTVTIITAGLILRAIYTAQVSL